MIELETLLDNITVNTHSSVRISAEGTVVRIDPFGLTEAQRDADVIFVTHEHFDHFSPEDIAKVLKPETVFVMPHSTARAAKELAEQRRVLAVAPGDVGEAAGLRFAAVPAYNPNKPFHPRQNGWVGYVLTVGGLHVYIAGDTDATEEAAAVRCDVALLPIGGKYTMDAKEAAALADRIGPQAVIPIHYGSVVGSPKEFDRFAAGVPSRIRVCKKL